MFHCGQEECAAPVEGQHSVACYKHHLNPPVTWLPAVAVQAVGGTLLCLYDSLAPDWECMAEAQRNHHCGICLCSRSPFLAAWSAASCIQRGECEYVLMHTIHDFMMYIF